MDNAAIVGTLNISQLVMLNVLPIAEFACPPTRRQLPSRVLGAKVWFVANRVDGDPFESWLRVNVIA